MASAPIKYTLYWPDGSAATAQEVYDAFMSGTVILEETTGTIGMLKYPSIVAWCDINSSAEDPTNVGCVMIVTPTESVDTTLIVVGDSSLFDGGS